MYLTLQPWIEWLMLFPYRRTHLCEIQSFKHQRLSNQSGDTLSESGNRLRGSTIRSVHYFVFLSGSVFLSFASRGGVISHESVCASYMRIRFFLPCTYTLEVKWCRVLRLLIFKFLVHYRLGEKGIEN